MSGRVVTVTIDRPLGSYHPKHSDIYYLVNYGYVEGVMGGDGEEQDAYVLGVDHPVESFPGRIIAVIHRVDDVEDKWVVAPKGAVFTKEEIRDAVQFQEQYFDSRIELLQEITYRSLNEQEFAQFRAWWLKDQTWRLMAAGQHTDVDAACEEAARDFDSLAAKGAAAPGMACLALQNESGADVGMIWYVMESAETAFVAEFVIAPEYRRKGYGEAALRRIAEQLRAKGVKRMLLHVLEHNRPARALYEKLGFRRCTQASAEAGGVYMVWEL